MKEKIILVTALATLLLNGCADKFIYQDSETGLYVPQSDAMFDYSKVKDSKTRIALYSMVVSTPEIALIYKDYVSAKHCNDDFYMERTSDEFLIELDALEASSQWDALTGYYFSKDRKSYNDAIRNYKFMNCGTGSLISKSSK